MTTEEAIRTQAARGDLSPRRTIRRALDSLDSGKDAIISALLYTYGAGEPVSKLTIEYAAQQARLAADLLQALAERVK